MVNTLPDEIIRMENPVQQETNTLPEVSTATP
jgi:hypothetical protein